MPHAGSPKILIVDDDPNVRAVLMQYLSTGYACTGCHSAFDALNKIKHEPYALVITDIRMPGMSGMELLRLVRKQSPDTVVIVITGVTDIATAVDSLRTGACDFITKPFDLMAVQRAVDGALERRQLLLENRHYQLELEKKVRERTLELNKAMGEVEDSYRMTLEALVTALDAREHETQAHSLRVRAYAQELAGCLGIQGAEMVQLGRGALLHDVGKIGVPDSILLKPGRLNEQEWTEMRRHPAIGYDILRGIKFLESAAEVVLCHQECWDGSGYPGGIANSDIPLGARIFAVVDTMDAMTSDRPYRRALSFQAAAEEIVRCAGTQFDPHIVEAYMSVPRPTWERIHGEVTNRETEVSPTAAS